MDEAPKPVELLLLRIIDRLNDMQNDYRLERFFAKTAIFSSVNDDKRLLVKKGWLMSEYIHPLNYYTITPLGKQVLQTYYNTDSIQHYIMDIEPTGFVLSILHKIDEREKEQ